MISYLHDQFPSQVLQNCKKSKIVETIIGFHVTNLNIFLYGRIVMIPLYRHMMGKQNLNWFVNSDNDWTFLDFFQAFFIFFFFFWQRSRHCIRNIFIIMKINILRAVVNMVVSWDLTNFFLVLSGLLIRIFVDGWVGYPYLVLFEFVNLYKKMKLNDPH